MALHSRTAWHVLGSVLIAILAILSPSAPAFAETATIHAGRLITDASKPPRGPSTVTVTDGRIVAVADGFIPAPEGSRLIDLSNMTVLPGLIDAHVHLAWDLDGDYRHEAVDTDEWYEVVGVKNARITVRAGFTTVRDVGGPSQVLYALRRGTEEGLIEGPRIVTSGALISIIGGHGSSSRFRPDVMDILHRTITCTGPVECTARVREASRDGADLIKIAATGGILSQESNAAGQEFNDAELQAIVETAHSLGLKVAAHALSARGIEAAANAGVDSIEHGTFADSRAIAAMKAHGAVLVPTLMAFVGVRELLDRNALTPAVAAKARAFLPEEGKAARAARAAGVPIVFGTDAAAYPHGRNAEEFEQMVRLIGMTSAEAIAAATTGAARLLGLDDQVGRIAPGYSADLIAVSGNPLDDVRTLQHVGFVMARGKIVRDDSR